MAADFSAQELRDLKMVYEVFDASGAGLIDANELRKALRVLGFKVSLYTRTDFTCCRVGNIRHAHSAAVFTD